MSEMHFPRGKSANDFLSIDFYLGQKVDLVIYSKVDGFVQIIKQKGQGYLMLKTDLRRAYRQLHICPSSYNLLAFVWKNISFVIQCLPYEADLVLSAAKDISMLQHSSCINLVFRY